jgi:hypothetical protein
MVEIISRPRRIRPGHPLHLLAILRFVFEYFLVASVASDKTASVLDAIPIRVDRKTVQLGRMMWD